VLVNGEPGDLILHQRGLRQRDPLSPLALHPRNRCSKLVGVESFRAGFLTTFDWRRKGAKDFFVCA
jgi:hypothetical protein